MHKQYLDPRHAVVDRAHVPVSGWLVKTMRRVLRAIPGMKQVGLHEKNIIAGHPTWGGMLAKKIPHTAYLHGTTIEDDYKYLEDPYHKDTIQYTKAEIAMYTHYTDTFQFKQAKHQFWRSVDGNMLLTTREGGFDKGEERIGDWIYFTRSDDQHSGNITFHRKRVGETDSLAEELINPEKLQQQFGYESSDIGICRVSENGRMLAYTLSVEGGDRFICHVRSLDSAAIFHVIRSSNITSVEFGSSNNFFYVESNELNRPYRVMMQEMRPGILPEPIELYRDEDEEFFVDIRKTKDGKYVIISSDNRARGNICILPSSYPVIPKEMKGLFPDGRPVEIASKENFSWLEHHGKHFVMVTGATGEENYRIVYAREEMVLRDRHDVEWADLVPSRKDVQIQDVDIFKTHLLVFEQSYSFEKSSQVRVLKIADGVDKSLDRSKDLVLHFPPMAVIHPGLNRNFMQNTVEFTYSALMSPVRECTYLLESELTPEDIRVTSPHMIYTVRQHEFFTPWDYMWPYTQFRDVAMAPDGEDIPITIVMKRDNFCEEITDHDDVAAAPKNCLMYVYGAYGETPPMYFQPAPYAWLIRRRWVVAFAHIRGGGEKEGWADAGKGNKKMNSVTDLEACCEHMIHMGYTTPRLMVLIGASAGAVPIAAIMNQRGNELFNWAFMRSPFLDIISTMCDPTLPLTLAERPDWGDPLNNPEDLEYLKQYDPYYNINKDVIYPSICIGACLDDDRVPAFNSLKYIAKMRATREDIHEDNDDIARPFILRLEPTGGHGHWNKVLQIGEEVQVLRHYYDLSAFCVAVEDMDMTTKTNNCFLAGMFDHDDAIQTHMKWDAWEYERIDQQMKMFKMSWEPNFRVLQAGKKEEYGWDRVERDDAPPPPVKDATGTGVNHEQDPILRSWDQDKRSVGRFTANPFGGVGKQQYVKGSQDQTPF